MNHIKLILGHFSFGLIIVAGLSAAQTNILPGGQVTHPLPAPEARFITRLSTAGSVTVTSEPSRWLLGPFQAEPSTTNRFKKLTYTDADGTTTATFTQDPFAVFAGQQDLWSAWQISGPHSFLLGNIQAWFGTVDRYYNPEGYADAVELTSTYMKRPYIVPGTGQTEYRTWTLSDGVPPRVVANVSNDLWSDWIDASPIATRFGDGVGNVAQTRSEYKVVASPELLGKVVSWMEIFTPWDDPGTPQDEALNKEYQPRSWLVDGRLSGEYGLDPALLNQARFGYYTVEMIDQMAQLAVDANRDGEIKLASEDGSDTTTALKQYRFWINDDDDRSYDTVAWSDSDPERYPPQQADSADQIVNSPRDCEDLARIWINAAGLIDTVKDPASDLYLGLKWKNTNGTHPSIRLFRSADTNGGLGYIKDATIGLQQATITPPGGVGAMRSCLGDADAATVANPPAAFPWTSGITQVEPIVRAADFVFRKDALPDIFGNRSTGYLLFEGVQEGKGELMLVIVRKKSDGTWEKVSDGGSVWLQLDNIRRMYVRAHSLPLPENFPHPWQVNSPPPSPYEEDVANEKALSIPDVRLWYGAGDSVESSTTFPFAPSPGEQNKCVIFVHGIDMNVPEMHGYTHSFFKRLWWEGYRGRFISFRWCTPLTTDGQWGYSDGDENTSIFNSGEYRSWKGGASLKKFSDALRNPASPFYISSNPTIGLLAHSLGNACAGEALRQGMQVNSYVALKAAVPLSCYFPVGTAAPTNPDLVTAETNSPTPQNAGNLNGYHGYLSSIGGANKINYYGARNFWLESGTTSFGLSVSWVTNQRKYKPDNPLDMLNVYVIRYVWDAAQQKGYFRKITDTVWNRRVTDAHESMAFVARPKTSALGAVSPGASGLPGFTGLDLESDLTYDFGPARFDHSGPFQRNIQLMYGNESGSPWSEPLYVRLMRDLQVSP